MAKYVCSLLSSVVFMCGCETLQTRDVNDLKPPGFLDIGAGYAFLENTNDSGSDASGVMLSLKGYPLGRWYSTERDIVIPKERIESSFDSAADGTSGDSDNKTTARLARLGDEVELLRRAEKYVVCDETGHARNTFWNRLSIYYGISSEDFQGGDEDCTVHSLGIGVDVTPEFALVAGIGIHNSGSRDRDLSVLFGVSLNLHAFSSLTNGVLGQ